MILDKLFSKLVEVYKDFLEELSLISRKFQLISETVAPLDQHNIESKVPPHTSVTMVLSDALLIVGISLFTAFLGEGVTYLMVYRTDKYQKLKVEIEKQTKKCKSSGR